MFFRKMEKTNNDTGVGTGKNEKELILEEEKSKELEGFLQVAQFYALDFKDFTEKITRLKFLRERKDKTKFFKEIIQLKEEITKSSVTLKSVDEFNKLLEKTGMDEEIRCNIFSIGNKNIGDIGIDSLNEEISYTLYVSKLEKGFDYFVSINNVDKKNK